MLGINHGVMIILPDILSLNLLYKHLYDAVYESMAISSVIGNLRDIY